MKSICLAILIGCLLFTGGCIWVGSTVTGEIGLYYTPPYKRQIYQARTHFPYYLPYCESATSILGYRAYPRTWRYWR